GPAEAARAAEASEEARLARPAAEARRRRRVAAAAGRLARPARRAEARRDAGVVAGELVVDAVRAPAVLAARLGERPAAAADVAGGAREAPALRTAWSGRRDGDRGDDECEAAHVDQSVAAPFGMRVLEIASPVRPAMRLARQDRGTGRYRPSR